MSKILLAANTDWYLYNYRLSLARAARAAGHQVVTISPAGDYKALIEKEGFPHIPWQVSRQSLNPVGERNAYSALIAILKQEQPDLAHFFTIKPVLYGSLAAKKLNLPGVVNSVPGRGYVFLSSELKARILRPLVRLAYRQALHHPNLGMTFENLDDQTFFLKNRLARPGRAFLLPGGGVDVDYFSPTSEPPGEPVIVYAGRLLWDKGVGTLVEAVPLLRQRVKVRVALAGMPDPGNPSTIDEATLQKWVNEGVIEWWGWQADMRQVYARSHIVVLPTIYGEGLPRSLLEAAACARPIVASDIPACQAIVADGKNGYLVPPRNPQVLADALEKLVANPNLRLSMGAYGRKLAVDQFSDHLVDAALLEIYRMVLEHDDQD
jgi:glycosyltransferase involved in cell wall biosynthesis